MENSEQTTGKRVSDYFNHGRHTSPGTWYPDPIPEPNIIHQQEIQPPLQQKGGRNDD